MIKDWEWRASIEVLNEAEEEKVMYQIRNWYGSTEWERYKKFGITPQDYDEMFMVQNKVCAICGKEDQNKNGTVRLLSLDHNHITGKVRGLLCTRCNTALGLLREEPETIKAMLRYLEEHGEKLGSVTL